MANINNAIHDLIILKEYAYTKQKEDEYNERF